VKSQSNPPNTFQQNVSGNTLWQYVQSLSPETVSQLSQPESAEVFQVIEQNIIGLLGNLAGDNFEVTINTNRENLGRLLASAMMSGYFLRNAEQRMTFEESLLATQIDGLDS
jgi:hypothetical protein